MSDKDIMPVGRLALRSEGKFWNAYWVPEMEGMQNAVLIGSLRMVLCDDYPERKAQFQKLVTDIAHDVIERVIGRRPEYTEERPAPEGERTRE